MINRSRIFGIFITVFVFTVQSNLIRPGEDRPDRDEMAFYPDWGEG